MYWNYNINKYSGIFVSLRIIRNYKKQLYILYLNLMEQLNYPETVLPPFNLRKIYEMYVARKNLISFDDISLRIPRLSASHLNIRRVIEKKTF